MTSRRLSICYVAPGHDLLGSAGPSRNVLSLAETLGRWAEVTVAFRRVLEPVALTGFNVIEIEPTARPRTDTVDDAAVSGIGLSEFLAYLGAVRRFVDEHHAKYDVVLEKSWLLSGYLVSRCRQRHLPGAVVENVVRVWTEPGTPRSWARHARHCLAQALTARYLRHAPLVIAETSELKQGLIGRFAIDARRVCVIGLGVDHRVFRPRDQAEARRALDIALHPTVLLYAGALDRTHDLTPVLQAMPAVPDTSLELHIVGDGRLRDDYVAKAGAGARRVHFHGRVPHADVPRYIAAADACIAPYDVRMFPGGLVAYSTLKIPEYMACARPVVSVPSGRVTDLIRTGVSGFLFANDVGSWAAFLGNLPPRTRLREMGQVAARRVASLTWDRTAAEYLRVCEALHRNGAPRNGPRQAA